MEYTYPYLSPLDKVPSATNKTFQQFADSPLEHAILCTMQRMAGLLDVILEV